MLTLSRPLGGLSELSRELDQLFWGCARNGNRAGFSPAVDVEEKEDSFLISADLPGMSEKDLEVKVHDGVLLLSGKREASKVEETKSGYYSERSFGSFCRSFNLGEDVDPEKIEASYANGVLVVKLPKKEQPKPRQIPVGKS